jgi:hypothetical protein
MKNIISDTDLETASLEALWGISTATMKEEAEEVATAEMAKISQPICGAREIVIAGHLRKRLAAERASLARFMKTFASA